MEMWTNLIADDPNWQDRDFEQWLYIELSSTFSVVDKKPSQWMFGKYR